MKTLINSSTYRRLHFIELLDQLPSWCDTKEIAAEIGCSVKTLLSDITFINEFWGKYLYIEYSKFQGVRLNNITSNKLSNIYNLVYAESVEFQFIEKMLSESNQDAEYWINELFISEASFYRMVNTLEAFLERRGLTLERAPFRITGPDERWVRFFYQQYFSEAYGVKKWPFAVSHEETVCFIMRVSTEFDVSLDDREIQESAFLFIVSLKRMHQGFFLPQEVYAEEDDTIDKVLNYSTPLAEHLVRDTEYTLSEKWYREISRTVFHEFYNWDNPQQMVRIQNKIEAFLNALSDAVQLPIAEEDRQKITQTMMTWYVEYNFYPYRLDMLYDKHQRFAREIQTVYPIFSTLVKLYLADIEKKAPELWTDIRLTNVYYLLMKEWRHLLRQLEKLRRKVSILVVSDLGQRHAEMLQDFIVANYHDRVLVSTYKEAVLFTGKEDFDQFDQYDIILSNNPINGYNKKNILIVNNFFSLSDRENLVNFIVAIQKRASQNHLNNLGDIKLKTAKKIYFPQSFLQ
ncbi:helix-turn-helix domain-containing protein [Enterococcus hermanniensis]|uniref:Mga helix-turn-helix domain-containing protein n=1 Tax=Enterococcus hermanniensis TaxID=249189 RepID=A0A1L8TP73_9ENTE|nr:helix-turn-helix domain-containing protein [Enterococcus hermanniensis]OJG46135.1 hypothetical protein RV04_GL001301 [Enterococcus hermanniensis]